MSLYPVVIHLPLKDYEVPDLRESIGWDRHDQYFPELLHRTIFWAGVRNEVGRLIGFGYITGPGMPHGYMEDIIVHPEFQNKGIGKSLVQRLLEEANTRKIGIITVSFDPRNGDFYERCGFLTSGGGLWTRSDH
ncbi:GNAT family N-acetyltransferase [Paenibacillus daejeonensis]|uniref:GNAT family N-acetyltransferase n=1 Tax=Paenibacillus daejeonensis TaxID=135193 RepID=UPI00036AA895|nr:GNAT family N-acetyltransferase [Paenibacillus daejeonensis]